MAQPANTYDTYDTIGIREDLLDKIYNVDPDETPFLSKIGKTTAKSTLHEWQTDQLDTPVATNAHVEGDDENGVAITPTVRLTNQTQIFKKPFTITGTMEAVDRAGRNSEQAYQALLKSKAIKTDMEMSAFANNAKVAGNNSTARELAGIPTWLTSNTSAGTGGSDAAGTGADARTDGTQRAFTSAILDTVLASVWDNSGKQPDCVFMGSHNRQVASGFNGIVSLEQNAKDKTVTNTVKIYEYDFGTVRFEPSRHVRARDALVLCTEMWAWAVLRPLRPEELAKTGDSRKYVMRSEATLVCRNEKASGGAFDLTTS